MSHLSIIGITFCPFSSNILSDHCSIIDERLCQTSSLNSGLQSAGKWGRELHVISMDSACSLWTFDFLISQTNRQQLYHHSICVCLLDWRFYGLIFSKLAILRKCIIVGQYGLPPIVADRWSVIFHQIVLLKNRGSLIHRLLSLLLWKRVGSA